MTQEDKDLIRGLNEIEYKVRYQRELDRKKQVSMKAIHDKARRLKHHRATNWIPVGTIKE